MSRILLKIILIFFVLLFTAFYFYRYTLKDNENTNLSPIAEGTNINQVNDPKPTDDLGVFPKSKIKNDLPISKVLPDGIHVFQSFNNCGPAAMSMALSYYDINRTQKQLGDILRPYQIANGDNDDKSVTLAELANHATTYDLIPIHRPNGDIETIKKFINNDIPVITRTWLKEDEDIGHFRVVKGYDELAKELIQDDSLQGKDLKYKYDDFNKIWKKFNFEYLVLIPKDKQSIISQILGENEKEETSWQNSVLFSKAQLAQDPNDVYARFNLSVALYKTGKFDEAVREYEKIEDKLSKRDLWYQIEPLLAYFELGEYDKILNISEKILNDGNRAYSELYILRGRIFLARGNKSLAKDAFEKAVFYNKNLQEAQKYLEDL